MDMSVIVIRSGSVVHTVIAIVGVFVAVLFGCFRLWLLSLVCCYTIGTLLVIVIVNVT